MKTELTHYKCDNKLCGNEVTANLNLSRATEEGMIELNFKRHDNFYTRHYCTIECISSDKELRKCLT